VKNGPVTKETSGGEIPEGMSEDARESWPSAELIKSWLGNELDFEMRLGEHTPIPDDPESAARARRFRDVLGLFASGVVVVTSMSDGEPVGMTCQSFSSVSLEPPLVMFSPAKTSRAWPRMQRAGYFCVNILAADQSDVSDAMATKGSDKYDGLGWRPASSGAPLLDGVLGYVDCTVQAVHEAGDHYVVLGRVKELGFAPGVEQGDGRKPLLYYRGGYDTVTREQ
jgi:3-hydroxy-9,10-secoandrosta-1,3,5(10)-triene-9,17-dione monooxygenase reductase component